MATRVVPREEDARLVEARKAVTTAKANNDPRYYELAIKKLDTLLAAGIETFESAKARRDAIMAYATAAADNGSYDRAFAILDAHPDGGREILALRRRLEDKVVQARLRRRRKTVIIPGAVLLLLLVVAGGSRLRRNLGAVREEAVSRTEETMAKLNLALNTNTASAIQLHFLAVYTAVQRQDRFEKDFNAYRPFKAVMDQAAEIFV
ncbi:MAG: hypothetical protein LIP77_06940, partial [Planctomycetes bacterium]|nr:hypothetical protein [Planctomycetota bacterium]